MPIPRDGERRIDFSRMDPTSIPTCGIAGLPVKLPLMLLTDERFTGTCLFMFMNVSNLVSILTEKL